MSGYKTGLNQSTSMRQEMKVNPRLYQAMDLLYMPLLDLQQHLQQELLTRDGTKPRSRRGGKRQGAGRPPKGLRSSAPHRSSARTC